MTKPDFKKKSDGNSLEKWGALWIVLLGITCVSFFLFRSCSFSAPLDRDEGEYAYGAHCLLRGLWPYEAFYSLKWPGIFACYSFIFSIFGESGESVHLGLAILQGVNAFLLFLLGKKWISSRAGFFSALFFLLLSLLPCFDGSHANAEPFVLLPSLLGILILNRGISLENKRLVFLAGFFFGMALLVKQHAFGYLLFSLLYVSSFRKGVGGTRIVSFLVPLGMGIALPFLAVTLLYWNHGALDAFWFWTVTYARSYVSLLDWNQGWMILKERLAEMGLQAGWCLGLIGLSSIPRSGTRKSTLWIWVLLACTLPTLFPGLYFRRHYFVMCLPPLALLAAGACENIFIRLVEKTSLFSKTIWASLFAVLLGWAFSQTALWKQEEDGNRFWQSFQSVALFLKERSQTGDSVAYLGSEPQIFFYSGLPNATPFLYAYPLMEPQPWALDMQNEMIRTVESKKPRFLLFHFSQPALGVTESSEKKIFYWFDEFRKKYRPILRVNYLSQTDIQFRQGALLEGPSNKVGNWLGVYERIDS